MEQALRTLIAWRGTPEPEAISARFDRPRWPTLRSRWANAAMRDRAAPPGADRAPRFRHDTQAGAAPRPRADMASHLRGVADDAEAETLALRYYDQSHLIREFTALFGMSPRQFMDRPQPLMTLSLETRQARRLEMTERIAPGGIRPWQ
jgi:hypothetical protein